MAQYKEPGQSYRQFLSDCPWLTRRKWNRVNLKFNPDGSNIKEKYPEGAIYLVPLGQFDDPSAPDFSSLVEYVSIFHGLPVKVLTGLHLHCHKTNVQMVKRDTESDAQEGSRKGQRSTSHRIKCRYNSQTNHTQLRISSLLATLKQYIPKDAFFAVALTTYDLYDEAPDLFVAGMASIDRVAVFSFFRYNPTLSFSKEFWYEIHQTKQVDQEVKQKMILKHSCKLVVHEIAHLLGVDHCIYYECCMNGSGHLTEDFRQPMFLCPVDLHKLKTLCGYNVIDRYKQMEAFFEKHGLQDEVKWLKKRLVFIKESES